MKDVETSPVTGFVVSVIQEWNAVLLKVEYLPGAHEKEAQARTFVVTPNMAIHIGEQLALAGRQAQPSPVPSASQQ